MQSFDSDRFRHVLGNFPTGVVAITARAPGGSPVGMTIGSFTSVSLDPPLVAFLPANSSTTWPKIREVGRFCVNVLAHDQEAVCRAFAMSGNDKFEGLSWTDSPLGSPILDGVVAWIDCEIETVHNTGDHDIVVGRVRDLSADAPGMPLVFFRGGYGRFLSLSLSAWEPDLGVQMAMAELAGPQLEWVARETGLRCMATTVVMGQQLVTAIAGSTRPAQIPAAVGHRFPWAAPLGTVFAAWLPTDQREEWMRSYVKARPDQVEVLESTIAAIREEGYTVGRGREWNPRLLKAIESLAPGAQPSNGLRGSLKRWINQLPPDYESPIRSRADWLTLNVPVFGPDHEVVMALTAVGPAERGTLRSHVDCLTHAAHELSRQMGPAPVAAVESVI